MKKKSPSNEISICNNHKESVSKWEREEGRGEEYVSVEIVVDLPKAIKGRKEETESEREKEERRGRKILLKLLRNVERADDIYLESYFRNSAHDLQYENPSSSRRNRKMLRVCAVCLLDISLHLVPHLVRLYDENLRRNRRSLHEWSCYNVIKKKKKWKRKVKINLLCEEMYVNE